MNAPLNRAQRRAMKHSKPVLDRVACLPSLIDEMTVFNAVDRILDKLATGSIDAANGEQFLAPYYGSGSGETGRSLSRPIGTITTRDRWAVINGDHMRMLNVAEARRAMGFPETYQLPDQHRLAMHMLGNAVCPPVACDVITAIKEAA